MAEWIKLRSGLQTHAKVLRIAHALNKDAAEVVFDLYRLAGWFAEQGHYGKINGEPALIDAYLMADGFADALGMVGWLGDYKGVLTLHEFCLVSATRKSLGVKVRRAVLSAGECAACGAKDKLVVDHKTPIVRGGSCDASNLQALCSPCNSRKGRKTMEEFNATRA